MKQVLVRGVEPELLERLKAIAKRRGRSLQAELREMMATHAAMHDRSRAAAEAARIRAAISKASGRTRGPDSTEMLRELREGRWSR